MSNAFGRTRKITGLRKGDIVNINAPYEENTRDYYNGYRPEEIRGRRFTDRFGNSSKTRMVIYIGRDENMMYYLPLTSKQDKLDFLHQYELKDNSMTPHADPNRHSYVEVDSLRVIYIPYTRNIDYTGRITKEDLGNILHRLSNTTLQFDSKQDQRGYVPKDMLEVFEQTLKERGYTLQSETEYSKKWTKENKTITHTKYGMMHYHVAMTKEEVRNMISRREGHDITKERPISYTRMEVVRKQNQKPIHSNTQRTGRKPPPKDEDTFSKAIYQLSNRQKGQESYANTC